jgi:hypothetical protein
MHGRPGSEEAGRPATRGDAHALSELEPKSCRWMKRRTSHISAVAERRTHPSSLPAKIEAQRGGQSDLTARRTFVWCVWNKKRIGQFS